MYKIYIKRHNGAVSHQTVTRSPQSAERAYRDLMRMREFWCLKYAAVLTLNSRQLEYRRFDRILPVDDKLNQLARRGDFHPTLPRVLYPADVEFTNRHQPHEYIGCYIEPVSDTLILDDATPIQLFHD